MISCLPSDAILPSCALVTSIATQWSRELGLRVVEKSQTRLYATRSQVRPAPPIERLWDRRESRGTSSLLPARDRNRFLTALPSCIPRRRERARLWRRTRCHV